MIGKKENKKNYKKPDKRNDTSQAFLQGNTFFQRPCDIISFLLLHFKRVVAVFKPLLILVTMKECFWEFFNVSEMIFFISPDRFYFKERMRISENLEVIRSVYLNWIMSEKRCDVESQEYRVKSSKQARKSES